MDFSEVKAITIPEGNVYRILSGTTVLWKKKTGLPVEYQEVEYLESTGRQYIDTGMVLNNGCVITLDFLMAESSVNRIVYGWRRKGLFTQPYQAYITSNTRKIRQIAIGRSADVSTYPPSFEYGVRNRVLIDSVNEQVLVNGVVSDCGPDFSNGKPFDEDGSSQYHPYLFALNNAGRAVAISEDTRIYGYSVQYGDRLLQSFVPCYRKIDKVAGMYDVVNGVFYTNAGTGKFNVGADVIVLPADYQMVEYIQGTSDANGANYINTLEYAKNTTRMELVCEITGFPNQYERLYGVRGAFWVMQYSTTSYRFYLDKPNRATLLKTQALSSDTEYVIVQDGGTTYLDGEQIATSSQAFDTETDPDMTYAPDGKIWLNADNGGNKSNSHLKIKSCMIWQNSVLTKHFVPCYRKIDNVAGMYDLVHGVFYTNPGTGSFTVGPDIITIPSEYQKVEYIQSSGTQYIQTSVTPNDNFRMDLRTYTTCGDSYYCAGVRASNKIWFGQTGTTTNNRVSASVNGTSVNASTDGVLWSRSTSGQTYEIMLCTNGNGTFTYHVKDLTNNKESLTENREYTLMGEATNGVCLFALNRNYIINGTNQFYYFRLYKNGKVAFDGIPCYRKSDNVVGLYDLVSKNLLVNSGTGSFTAGPDIT